MFKNNLKNNKRKFLISLLEQNYFNNHKIQFIFLEDYTSREITDEELYELCDHSIELVYFLKKFYDRKFLGLVLEVVGKTGAIHSTYITILCYIANVSVAESSAKIVLYWLLNLIGVVLQDRPPDEIIILEKIRQIYNYMVNNVPLDDNDENK